ncbi:unnamed protein product [Adineta steineri]|uniref:GH16 domain-containing protein n=1 Tax=Adineta steineri TaxID=433720 RepID=A0A815NQ97_9BILA|nr:unnamed protein product [Adineta steineri]
MSNKNYRLVWEDNFSHDGPVNPEKWEFDIGTGNNGWGNQEVQYDTDRIENARCENQRLIIEAHRENYQDQKFTSARLKSKASWTYGRLQTKAKLPVGKGLWPAIWMLPRTLSYGNAYWPDNGEIDIMEQVGYDPTRIVSSVHTSAFNHIKGTQPTNGVQVSDACTDFKIYTMNWTPNQIEMFVGNENNPFEQRILVWVKGNHGWEGWPFDKNFFIVLNIAVGGSWGGQHGIDESIFPKRMEIKWIRFYEIANGIDNVPTSTKVVSLRSNANGKFVCADNYGNSPLIANRDSAAGWEKFDPIFITEKNIALRSHANGRYVCAENRGNESLIANRTSIESWETFQIIDHGNEKVSFIAVNGKYVCADNFGNSALVANRDSANAWEIFDLISQ